MLSRPDFCKIGLSVKVLTTTQSKLLVKNNEAMMTSPEKKNSSFVLGHLKFSFSTFIHLNVSITNFESFFSTKVQI